MTRRFISQLGEHEDVDEVFLASEKQLRANRNGNLYLQVRMADRTGFVTAMLWNANDQIYGSFENGDYLHVHGKTQFYNGSLQMILSRVERANSANVNDADFVTLNREQVDQLATRAGEILRGIDNFHLRNLAECFLMDEAFMTRFSSAPAGIKNHHAYQGGLLEHAVSLMEVVLAVAPRYPFVDRDLLLMGAFLHDVGKTEELSYERELAYTDHGQLIGHLVIGVSMLDEKIQETAKLSGEPFPNELTLRLRHMIVSHHGEYEYGSPKLPMTLEAVALHYLDNLDAKLHSITQIIQADANTDSRWTTFQPQLSRKFYKGF